MPWTARVTFDLLDQAESVVTANVAGVFDERCQAVFNGPGSGQLSIDPATTVAAILAAFPIGHHIQVKVDGVAIFTWTIEDRDAMSVSPDEEVGLFVQLAGRGWACVMERAVTFPSAPLTSRPAPDYRIFSFASYDYPNEADGWVAATSHGEQGTFNPDRFSYDAFGNTVPAPANWSVPTAEWIWGDGTDDEGVCYFRRTYNAAGPVLVAIEVTADNFYTLYLDGTPIKADTTNPACWRDKQRYEVELSTGDHVFAAKVENLPGDGINPNPAGLLFAMFTMDAGGLPDTVLLVSDDSWLTLAYPTVEPGWTAGQIIGVLRAEGATRGVLGGLAEGFDDVNDTASVAWATIPLLSVPMGDSLLRVVQQLEREGWIDWRMAGDVFRLDMWNKGGLTTSSGVTYFAAPDDDTPGNIAELHHVDAHPIRNSLLVRYPGSYTLVDDAASITANGLHEGYLTVDASSVDEAARKGEAALDEVGSNDESATAQIEPLGADIPFVDVLVGEFATVPNRAGTPTSYRAVALSLENPEGDPLFVVDFNRRPG